MIDFKVLKAVYPPRAARAARENKRPGYPVRQEFMNPPARLDLGLMMNVDADHPVKFDAQLVRVRLCRRSFAFFGSGPERVVEHLRSILWGQNLNNCPDARPVTLCNSSSITRNITRFDLIFISC